MKKICFFNHYHNGDLFHSKSFIREIVENIQTEFFYAHSNNPVVISDLGLIHSHIPDIYPHTKYADDGYNIFINTWIGSHFDKNKPFHGECTLRFSYQMFGEIYDHLNSIFSTALSLKPIESYFPFVDYTKFNCSNIDQFLSECSQDKVLFSNGPCNSGQSHYNGNMSEIIEECAVNNPDKVFIATNAFDTKLENIKFTSDIIKVNGCDLNEISYLSRFCKLIVGRNSGPFCFSTTGENIMDPNKTFYAFGERETDCFYYDMDIDCNFIFEKTSNVEEVRSSVVDLVNNL